MKMQKYVILVKKNLKIDIQETNNLVKLEILSLYKRI